MLSRILCRLCTLLEALACFLPSLQAPPRQVRSLQGLKDLLGLTASQRATAHSGTAARRCLCPRLRSFCHSESATPCTESSKALRHVPSWLQSAAPPPQRRDCDLAPVSNSASASTMRMPLQSPCLPASRLPDTAAAPALAFSRALAAANPCRNTNPNLLTWPICGLPLLTWLRCQNLMADCEQPTPPLLSPPENVCKRALLCWHCQGKWARAGTSDKGAAWYAVPCKCRPLAGP